MGFSKLGLAGELKEYYKEHGFKDATEIQKKAIPELIKRNHLVAVAPTGTGKTLSYALPLMNEVKKVETTFVARDIACPLAIIIAPTRELCTQIHGQFKSISHHLKLRVRKSSGGKVTNDYLKLIKSEFEILVATPTRLKMAIDKGHLDLSYCQFCVLDEADQMFDMGFAKELGVVFHRLPKEDCTMGLFSATMSEGILEYVEQKFSRIKWKKAIVGKEGYISKRIESFNVHCGEKDKPRLMAELIKKSVNGRGIIFCNNFERVNTVFKYLTEDSPKLKIKILHGKLDGKERQKTHKAFQDGKFQILLATDIAARGLDVKDLNWVVNYELPSSFIYYVHRSGRVARGKRSGVVYNLISAVDEKRIVKINEVIREQGNIDIDLIRMKKKGKKKAQVKEKRVKPTKRNEYQTKKKVVKGGGAKSKKPTGRKPVRKNKRR